MSVLNVNSINITEAVEKAFSYNKPESIDGNSFLNVLNNAIARSDKAVESYVLDQNVEVQDVMIALENAKMSMEIANQVRNRSVEGLQQLFRMQI